MLKFPGLVSYDSREAAFRDEDPQRCLAEAIYAGGAFADNWYHWLLEILPRIWLTRLLPGEYVETPILVPERVLGSPNHRASLEQIVGSDRIVALPSWGAIDVERLVWIDGMFDMAHIASPLGGAASVALPSGWDARVPKGPRSDRTPPQTLERA